MSKDQPRFDIRYDGEAEYVKLWDIVQFGLGGYVVGRSTLQVAQAVAPAITAGLAGKK